MYLRRDHKPVFVWLTACALLVACMVMLGGYTRLSGSGLSITSWKPIHGTLPPLNYAQWEEEFTAYRQSPQFQQVNYDMKLDEFKAIFWPEFLHRLLGRAIGILFFVPYAIFLWRNAFHRRFGYRLLMIFTLGGLQGLVGWLMVASGLIDEPRVSHLRLALHLAMAFAIFALILWSALDIRKPEAQWAVIPNACLTAFKGWFALLCIQIVFGAFMAGLHGGLVYNTWPDMNGQFAPDDLWYMSPWLINFTSNIATVQFTHRTLAAILAISYGFWWYLCSPYVTKVPMQKLCAAVALIIATQFALGVLTLLHMVPLPLAWLHQLTGLILFAAGIMLMHRLSAARYRERHVE